MVLHLNVNGEEFDLEFHLKPPVSQWEIVSKSEDGSHATYRGNGYTDIGHPEGTPVTFRFRLRRTELFSVEFK